jgi:Pretoxin HINT domain
MACHFGEPNIPMTKLNEQPPGFAADTMIHTDQGLKAIQHIAVGDLVLSYPRNMQPPSQMRRPDEYTFKRVARLMVADNGSVSRLLVFHLATGEKEELFAARLQPIYCKEKGWIDVGSIRPTNVVENHYFGNMLLSRVHHDVARASLYALDVEEFCTYYVGKLGTWVGSSLGL